jgi:hypothetical protein
VSINRFAVRRDTNERAIIEALVAEGFDVEQLSKPFDLLVWRRNGVGFVLIEVKNGAAGRITDDQVDFLARTTGLPRVVARTADEALAAARHWC